MRKLVTCVGASDALRQMRVPCNEDAFRTKQYAQETEEAVAKLPPVQQRLARGLMAYGVALSNGGELSGLRFQPCTEPDERVQAYIERATPVAAFVTAQKRVKRLYEAQLSERSNHVLIEVSQFGPEELATESVVTVSRALVHSGVKASLPPALTIGIFAEGSQLLTGVMRVYGVGDAGGTNLKAVLKDARVDVRRSAARSVFAALRNISSKMVLANNVALEEIQLSNAGCLMCLTSPERCTADAADTAAMVMLARIAGQASRVAGPRMAREFMEAALEVADTPAWRHRLLRNAGAGVAAALRVNPTLFGAEECSLCTDAAACDVKLVPDLLVSHVPHLLHAVDAR
jgi:cell division septum initiation protein DivIVA